MADPRDFDDFIPPNFVPPVPPTPPPPAPAPPSPRKTAEQVKREKLEYKLAPYTGQLQGIRNNQSIQRLAAFDANGARERLGNALHRVTQVDRLQGVQRMEAEGEIESAIGNESLRGTIHQVDKIRGDVNLYRKEAKIAELKTTLTTLRSLSIGIQNIDAKRDVVIEMQKANLLADIERQQGAIEKAIAVLQNKKLDKLLARQSTLKSWLATPLTDGIRDLTNFPQLKSDIGKQARKSISVEELTRQERLATLEQSFNQLEQVANDPRIKPNPDGTYRLDLGLSAKEISALAETESKIGEMLEEPTPTDEKKRAENIAKLKAIRDNLRPEVQEALLLRQTYARAAKEYDDAQRELNRVSKDDFNRVMQAEKSPANKSAPETIGQRKKEGEISQRMRAFGLHESHKSDNSATQMVKLGNLLNLVEQLDNRIATLGVAKANPEIRKADSVKSQVQPTVGPSSPPLPPLPDQATAATPLPPLPERAAAASLPPLPELEERAPSLKVAGVPPLAPVEVKAEEKIAPQNPAENLPPLPSRAERTVPEVTAVPPPAPVEVKAEEKIAPQNPAENLPPLPSLAERTAPAAIVVTPEAVTKIENPVEMKVAPKSGPVPPSTPPPANVERPKPGDPHYIEPVVSPEASMSSSVASMASVAKSATSLPPGAPPLLSDKNAWKERVDRGVTPPPQPSQPTVSPSMFAKPGPDLYQAAVEEKAKASVAPPAVGKEKTVVREKIKEVVEKKAQPLEQTRMQTLGDLRAAVDILAQDINQKFKTMTEAEKIAARKTLLENPTSSEIKNLKEKYIAELVKDIPSEAMKASKTQKIVQQITGELPIPSSKKPAASPPPLLSSHLPETQRNKMMQSESWKSAVQKPPFEIIKKPPVTKLSRMLMKLRAGLDKAKDFLGIPSKEEGSIEKKGEMHVGQEERAKSKPPTPNATVRKSSVSESLASKDPNQKPPTPSGP